MKKRYIIIPIIIILALGGLFFLLKYFSAPNEDIIEYNIYEEASYYKINSYDDYLKYQDIFEDLEIDYLENKNYILVKYTVNSCGESLSDYNYNVKNNKLYVNLDLKQSCGVCAPEDAYLIIEASNIDDVIVGYKFINTKNCDPDVVYKPIIYIYPDREMDLTVTVGNPSFLTHTYPLYVNNWNVHVTEDGNIYDYNTKRNYYALYWEAIDNTKNDMSEGFVVEGKDTVAFLEEKLAILGLNDYEINEFIVYWIDKLENNKYNYIYFRTTEEVEKYMPLYFSTNPDTLIRVIMDFKPLDNFMEVKNQQLEKVNRNGFAIVEWGGRRI